MRVQEWRPVQLSKAEKAGQAVLSNDNMSVTMRKGYRMVGASPGVPASERDFCSQHWLMFHMSDRP